MRTFKTRQERFWAGPFGDRYIARNNDGALLASNTAFFSTALRRTRNIGSVLEVGANIGLNLRALSTLLPGARLAAVEINKNAVRRLVKMKEIDVSAISILDFKPARQYDLVLSKGVLIHLPPERLPEVYDKLANASARYVLLAEYFNPSPVSIPYRGHANVLFKRDFAGEFLDRHKQWRLMDYGFVYRHDPLWPQDDITWFLLENDGREEFHA